MSDLDERITASLRERAQGPVDPSDLIAAATVRGRARRRQRIARRTVAVAVALVAAGTAAVLVPRAAPPELRFDGFAPYYYGDTQLPRALGVPGARARPDLVGTDPTVLHFDAISLTGRARRHTWTSGPGYERLEAAIGPDEQTSVTIGPDPAVLEAVGRAARLPAAQRQRLAADLWLRVEATSERLAREVVQEVNLDESQRCALPYRLPVRPTGAEVATCYVGFRYGHYAVGGVIMRAAGGRSMEVQAQYEPGFPSRNAANHRCAGRPAFVYPGGHEVELLGYPGLYLSARLGGTHRGFRVADADAVLGALILASNVELMRTWPPGPLTG